MDPLRGGRHAVAIMDIYAISRILRDFYSKKNGISSFAGTAQNVIYYAGQTHTANFVKFLTEYLMLKPKTMSGVPYTEYEKHFCQTFVDMGDITKTMVL